ncbi:unnamed protein product [Gadus morhua 'NCC']
MEKTYQVIVSGLNGENMTIDLCNTEEQMKAITVLQLKEKLGERVPGRAGNNMDNIRLIFANKNQMVDESTLGPVPRSSLRGLAGYVELQAWGVSYELYATVDHVGDLRGGHYTATIQPADDGGCWYDFNDSRVTPVSLASLWQTLAIV